MAGRGRSYLSYLLRLWLVDGDPSTWRASLESPTSGERHGFTSLSKLFAFLEAETRDLAAEEQWEQGKEVTLMASNQVLKDLLGRAMGDEEFRALLLENPAHALQEGGYDLTADQLAALLETDRGGIAEGLDLRLSKWMNELML